MSELRIQNRQMNDNQANQLQNNKEEIDQETDDETYNEDSNESDSENKNEDNSPNKTRYSNEEENAMEIFVNERNGMGQNITSESFEIFWRDSRRRGLFENRQTKNVIRKVRTIARKKGRDKQ